MFKIKDNEQGLEITRLKVKFLIFKQKETP